MVNRPSTDLAYFSPRDYQVELLDKACKRNIIVQLGTGSGKTFIAVLLLKEYGVQLYAPLDKHGKRAFFIVEKVNLVEQQAEHIERHTKFKVGRVHGQSNTDIWNSKEVCDKFINEHNVIVITAQCLLDLILHAFVQIQCTCVMIFDECHHALGSKHPYRLILKHYKELKNSNYQVPRILGLTASLIKEKTVPEKLEEKLMKLEAIMDCTIETASDLVSMSKFGAKPYQSIVICRNFECTSENIKETVTRVLKILKDTEEFVNSTTEINPDLDLDPRRPIRDSIKTTRAVLMQLGPWAAWKMSQMWDRELSKLVKTQMLPDKAKLFLNLAKTTIITIRRILEPKMREIRKLDQLKPFIPHRLVRLFEIMEMFNPQFQTERMQIEKPEKLCAIIFVEQRYVAYALQILIKHISKWEPIYQFIYTDYVVGASGSNLANNDNQGLHKRQGEVLRKFHKSELNVLIATSVLEEGVDVKQCNLVVKFDRPLDIRSYVQSKGRARKPGAKYVILIEEKDTEACDSDMRDFLTIEDILLNRCKSVHNPVENDILFDYDGVDSRVKPYVVESTGATVKMSTAIPLVNRYCGKLPSDIFTRLVPHNRIIPVTEDGVTKYRAELLLPINSPIKHAIELKDAMPNKKEAQMAVALEACRQLHLKGELDDNLLPKGRESIAKLLEHIDDEPDEYAPGLSAKVGSTKRKQLYDKKIASALNQSIVHPDEECYLYVFDLERIREPEFSANPKRRKFVNPTEYDYCFGFLSSNKLPKIPPFPVFLRQGDMRVRVLKYTKKLLLKAEEIEQIKHFHDYLFTQVLQLCKSGNLEFALSANTPANCLVVPLNKNHTDANNMYTINMSYVTQVVVNMRKMPRVPDEESRRNYKFNADVYKDAVVMPWYRNLEQPDFFYVSEILTDMHPHSSFPDTNYTTFNEYFIKKYNLEIYDQNQCLLDVDFTSRRLNLLLPRSSTMRHKMQSPAPSEPSESNESVTSTSSQHLGGHSSQRQIFVPELMDVHPISATLWNLISALPSIFYRMNQLLLTDELRRIILEKAFGKAKEEIEVGENLEWPSLIYPYAQEESQTKVVKNIQQLRAINRNTVPRHSDKDKSGNDKDSFTIGVWDPEDAIRCGVKVDLNLNNGENLEDEDTAGLIHGLHDGKISDEDEDDLEPFVMHDYKQKFSSQLKSSNESDALWPEVKDIVATGWGELDENISGGTAPFEIIGDSGSSVFNLASLMEDVGRHVNVQASPVVNLENKGKEEQEKSNKNIEAIVREKLEAMDYFDERDRNRKYEEIVDLEKFDDDSDEESVVIKKLSSADAEIEELQRGEERKRLEDSRAVDAVGNRSGNWKVLSKENASMTFSFEKQSPSTNTCVVERESDGTHVNNDIGFGVSPCLLLTALTTSNASDGMSLERFETIGDSFLKYAVTDYLYHLHQDQHEGKLSFARSKEVSNCNLYRIGKKLGIPQLIVASKFDVQDSWLPPCYVPTTDFKAPNTDDAEERDNEVERLLNGQTIEEKEQEKTGWDEGGETSRTMVDGVETITFPKRTNISEDISPLPYNLLTQQNVSDKSIADAVEALIGVHLLSLGPTPTLKFMNWIGLKVMDKEGSLSGRPPLLRFIDTPTDPEASLRALDNIWQQFQFSQLEERIGYRFKDRAYLVQAFTHASYINNRITGCYQRLEFLGDAVLDYMITRYLFEDSRQYGPGVLTDLRSALVNNTIFASLAVKYEFQRYFIAMCPGLHHMIEKFVKLCAERNFDTNFNTEMYMATTEEEIDEGYEEDIEVPKAMGDIFESVAGAIYLDSGRNLDVTWTVIFGLMKATIEECCENPPRSPIRELMEHESSKARFSKMERIMETGKVRVTVDVGNNMRFTGMGRTYRIAKCTAAKRALKYIHAVENQRKNTEA